MAFLSRLPIDKKIYIIPLLAIVSFGVYLGITASIASTNAVKLQTAKNIDFPILRASDKVFYGLDRINEFLKSAATTADAEPLQLALQGKNEIMDDLARVDGMAPELSTEVNVLRRLISDYFSLAYGLSEAIINDTADMSKLASQSAKMNAAFVAARTEIEVFQTEQLKQFERQFDEANQSASRLVEVGLVLGGGTIFLILLVAVPVVVGIKRSLSQVVSSLKDIAQENGDLTVRLKSDSEDEIGELVFWFNSFVEKLQFVIRDVVEASGPLNELAESLNRVADDANSSIGQQREGTNRAKHAMEQMSASVADVANSARQAAQAASEANEAASDGQEVVIETVKNIQVLAKNVLDIQQVIGQLDEDSSRVGSVLDVIKSIADQTNLLALNAAIEAARAGEQGRGFAVVADEVRTLASRTQESTLEIQETIAKLQQVAKSAVKVMEESSEQAQVSVANANRAGVSLQAINRTIGNINQMNENIAEATTGQSQVVHDIVETISQIHGRTEQTSDRSVLLTGVSKKLITLAKEMSVISNKFRV